MVLTIAANVTTMAAITRKSTQVREERLRRWAVHQRVELLCLGGLWLKVPPEEWDAWVDEYERSRDLCLSRPFPPEDFFSHETPQDRMRPLADVLCYPPNTLTQRWRRQHKRL